MSANASGRFGLYFAGRHDSSRCSSITMMKRMTPTDYDERPLSDGYPGLTQLAVEYFRTHQSTQSLTIEAIECVGRLIDLSAGLKTIAVVGCGPNPRAVRGLVDAGFDAVGVEPVQGFLEAAREFLESPDRALWGTSEALPFPDGSQRVVVMESVLEHVDSPSMSLREAYRVPGTGRCAVYHDDQSLSLFAARCERRVPDTLLQLVPSHAEGGIRIPPPSLQSEAGQLFAAPRRALVDLR